MSDRLDFDLALDLPGFALRMAAELPASGVTALLGPSGAGKTTLLRALAGLVPARGPIALAGERLDGLPAHRRGTGFVFQEPRLFDHLSVAQNLAYGARRRGGTRAETDAIAAALDLGPLLGRRIGGLSGGEARRVALGRALASRPRLLLLDEPMSGLDRARKAEILPYLATALGQSGVPALLVSHAEDETLSLAHRILGIEDGRVTGLRPGPPLLTARVTGVWGGMARLEIGGSAFSLRLDTEPGARWALALPEGGAHLAASAAEASEALARLPATMTDAAPDHLRLRIGGQTLFWPAPEAGRWRPGPGEQCVMVVTRVIARPLSESE